MQFLLNHFIIFHDFKWTAILDGPIFVVASYFEALANNQLAATENSIYDGAGDVGDRMMLACLIYGFISFSQFLQQRDLSILIIQKSLIAQQQT
jgi:hypothetical protein